MATGRASRFRQARVRYLGAGLLLLVLVVLCGWWLTAWITQPDYLPLSRGDSAEMPANATTDRLFALAVERMQRRDYEAALQIWHRILVSNPDIPEVKVNMGFTLIELGRWHNARDFFTAAIEQDPFQANAYYGLALVNEQAGDLETALGAMRSYIHLAGADEDERFIRRARSALWEWESQLTANRESDAEAAGATPRGE